MSDPSVDFVVITALEEERDAVLGVFPDFEKLDKQEEDVHTYYRGTVPTRRAGGGSYNVVVACLTQMGPLHAAAQTAWIVSRWRPRGVLVVGIAGGVASEVALGDVLVAAQVVDYTVGKIEKTGDGNPHRRVRWEAYQTDMSLLDSAKNVGASWRGTIGVSRPEQGESQRYVGIVASGGDVIADPDFVAAYKDRWDKLIGVEMEGGGAATALHASSGRPRFLMIRSVSDFADKDKNAPNTRVWRPYACAVAAAFTAEFLRSGPLVPTRPGPSSTPGPGQPGPASPASPTHRQRDLRALTAFFQEVDLPTLDNFFERGLSGAIPETVFYYFEGVVGFVDQSAFHIADLRLHRLVLQFAEAFRAALGFGEYFEIDARGVEYKFVGSGRVPPDERKSVLDARSAFIQAVEKTRLALRDLVSHVKEEWPELNLDETSRVARDRRRIFHEQSHRDPERALDGSAGVPTEAAVATARAAILRRVQTAPTVYLAGSDEQDITLQLESPAEIEAARRLFRDGVAISLDGTRCTIRVRRQV